MAQEGCVLDWMMNTVITDVLTVTSDLGTLIFVEYDMYLRLLYFSIIWIKIPDGYQIVRV